MSWISLSQHNRTGWGHPETLLLLSHTQKKDNSKITQFSSMRKSPSEETQVRKKRYLMIWQNHVSYLLLVLGPSPLLTDWHISLIIFTFLQLFISKGHMAHRMENFYITPVRNTTLGILHLYINYSKHLLLEAVYSNITVHCDNHRLFQLASKKTVYWQNRVRAELWLYGRDWAWGLPWKN